MQALPNAVLSLLMNYVFQVKHKPDLIQTDVLLEAMLLTLCPPNDGQIGLAELPRHI
jgi:hypothetical protein